ncbi:MAG: hypothetical protein LBG70_04910 [Bifidobacteriaceae bacterium]|jgi:hypothetical protein|nr:hypothetical protein [Bifidobacteriaceae bacterium]
MAETVVPRRVVRICRLNTRTVIHHFRHWTSNSIGIAEYVQLSDGRRVLFRDDRGFGLILESDLPLYSDLPYMPPVTTPADVIETARNIIFPESADGLAGPRDVVWFWAPAMAALAEAGVDVSAGQLSVLPLDVELTAELLAALEPGTASAAGYADADRTD